jgi:hypothetical protein
MGINVTTAVSPEQLQSYLLCLHRDTTTELHTITNNINKSKQHLQEINSKLESLNVTLSTLLRGLSDNFTESKLTPDEIVPHYFWLIGALIAIGAVQLIFSLMCFILALRLNLLKSKNRVQRKGSTNTICSRLEDARPSSSAEISRRPQRTQDRQSRRLSSRFMRRFNPIRNNSTLIAFLSTPPSYRAPAPPPPPQDTWYQNVKCQHKKTHN